MLGLLLWYWIGKYFYKLAEEFEKSKWGFAILGIVIYYAGTILFGIIIMFIGEMLNEGYIETMNETVVSLIAFPFGILSCYVSYKYLEKTWRKAVPNTNLLIDEIGKTAENSEG